MNEASNKIIRNYKIVIKNTDFVNFSVIMRSNILHTRNRVSLFKKNIQRTLKFQRFIINGINETSEQSILKSLFNAVLCQIKAI